MLRNTYDDEVCSIARALEVVGERWSLLILRNALFAGSTRYGDFQRSLGIATNVLQDRLDGFVRTGLMERSAYSTQPELYEYVLTEKGRAFAPVLVALTAWGDRYAAPDGPPILYRHATCGSAVGVDAACVSCGPLEDRSVIQALPGPGMPDDRADRIRQRLAVQGVDSDTAPSPRSSSVEAREEA